MALGAYGVQSPENVDACNGRVADLSRAALRSWLLSPVALGRFTKDEVNFKVKEVADPQARATGAHQVWHRRISEKNKERFR